VRQNIHVVVTMSPMGEQFRSRLRMFPGLVNCCTIDWFGAWPGECATFALLQMTCIAVQFSPKQLADACRKARVTMRACVLFVCIGR
jgi:dynein heavy chain